MLTQWHVSADSPCLVPALCITVFPVTSALFAFFLRRTCSRAIHGSREQEIGLPEITGYSVFLWGCLHVFKWMAVRVDSESFHCRLKTLHWRGLQCIDSQTLVCVLHHFRDCCCLDAQTGSARSIPPFRQIVWSLTHTDVALRSSRNSVATFFSRILDVTSLEFKLKFQPNRFCWAIECLFLPVCTVNRPTRAFGSSKTAPLGWFALNELNMLRIEWGYVKAVGVIYPINTWIRRFLHTS